MKRWTMEEDIFLHEHFDAVGDFIGVHDLGRPPKSAISTNNACVRHGHHLRVARYCMEACAPTRFESHRGEVI